MDKPIEHKPHKMVRHTQTIRRQKPTDCLSVFEQSLGLPTEGLKQVLLACCSNTHCVGFHNAWMFTSFIEP